MANSYGDLDPYGNYGKSDELSPYELLLQLKAFNKAIYLTISNADEQIRTTLSVTEGEIKQEIIDLNNELLTVISTTAAGLQANITNTAAGLQSQITVNAGVIATKVSQTDYNGVTVASLISQSPQAINIVAQSIGLSGYVTFNSLTASGTTNIDGARITTGFISADRIQANTVLAKLIAAGGISADQITSGTISANRLSANAITSTLINAGGINASLITAGTISGNFISGGTIYGSTLLGGSINISTNATLGGYLTLNANNSGIYFGNYSQMMDDRGTLRITGGSGISITAPLGVYIEGYAQTRTDGLGFGYSSNGRLYVSLNGSDVGYVTLT